MKKNLTVLLILSLLFVFTACSKDNKEEEKKVNNEENEEIEDDIDISRKTFDMTDADKKEITNIFKHLGYYYDVNKDEKEEIWGVSLNNLYIELSKYKDSNKFANLLIEKFDELDFNNWNKLEKDFFDAYFKLIFIDVNTLYSSTAYGLDKIVKQNEINSVDKVYVYNYSESYDTLDQKYYRDLYFHFKKISLWMHALSGDGNGDDKYCTVFNKIEIPEDAKTSELDSKIINDYIKKDKELIDLLFQYRDEVFFNEKVKELRKIEKEEEKMKKKSQEPAIGMTKSDVENGAWGSPKKKNITETRYGTHEQWVYGNGRYVYFDNGIVSSVQKSG